MSDIDYGEMETLLTGSSLAELRRGLSMVKTELARLGSQDAQPLFEMLSAVFFIDPLDRPDLMPALDEALTLVMGFGGWVIPELVQQLDAGDLKVQMAVAHALGRIGADAIAPLSAEYRGSEDPERRAFILYALGRIKSAKIIEAVPLAIEATRASDDELRDTATRALGKFAESIPREALSTEACAEIETALRANLSDTRPSIRAKAVRSLGKLARNGLLEPAQRSRLEATLKLILGRDENFAWDRAYIVRREAGEALRHLGAAAE